MTMTSRTFPRLSAQEAAAMVPHGATVGFSGFTAAGAAKAVPRALAERAREHHGRGEPYALRVLAGASTGPDIDDALAEADAIAWRAPYQSSRPLRARINAQQCEFLDMHLSHLPQMIEFGFLGKIDVAVVEAVDVTPDGRVYLSSSVGISPSLLRHAGKVIIEINRHHHHRLSEMHDIMILPPPPHREPIPVSHAMSRVGTPFASVDPARIAGVVETDAPDGCRALDAPDEVCTRIAGHVVAFLRDEMIAGRIPREFLPLQAGVGNVANAVMAGLGAHPDVPPFFMYSEVFQDSLVGLLRDGKLLGVSATSLTVSEDALQEIYGDMGFFAPRVVLRPQELSNNPGIVRRLGVIAINTVLEADIYGLANSTHVSGTQIMNGVGGSGDFVRNAYLSLLVTPSVAKDGRISSIVPMVSHVDHTEHSVQVIVTEQGLADLRGLGPIERAHRIIERCAHPRYRDYLRRYLQEAPMGHFRHDLNKCFELHRNLIATGSMLPEE
jgi:succinate CoA transferase